MDDTTFWIASACDADLGSYSVLGQFPRTIFTLGEAMESHTWFEDAKQAALAGDPQ